VTVNSGHMGNRQRTVSISPRALSKADDMRLGQVLVSSRSRDKMGLAFYVNGRVG